MPKEQIHLFLFLQQPCSVHCALPRPSNAHLRQSRVAIHTLWPENPSGPLLLADQVKGSPSPIQASPLIGKPPPMFDYLLFAHSRAVSCASICTVCFHCSCCRSSTTRFCLCLCPAAQLRPHPPSSAQYGLPQVQVGNAPLNDIKPDFAVAPSLSHWPPFSLPLHLSVAPDSKSKSYQKSLRAVRIGSDPTRTEPRPRPRPRPSQTRQTRLSKGKHRKIITMSVRGGATGEEVPRSGVVAACLWPECTSNKENSKRQSRSSNHGQGCRSLVQWICVPSHKLCSLYDRHVDMFFSLVSAFSRQLSPRDVLGLVHNFKAYPWGLIMASRGEP